MHVSLNATQHHAQITADVRGEGHAAVATCAAVAANFGRVGGSPVGCLTAMPVPCLDRLKNLAM